jgi:hypothetical protein
MAYSTVEIKTRMDDSFLRDHGMMAYLLNRHYPQQTWLIKLVAAGMILAIGLSRVVLGVHCPADGLGGHPYPQPLDCR